MGDGLTITGGANGVTARFDDLRAQASLLDAIAGDLGEIASVLASLSIAPDVAEAAVLCPLEAARAEEAVLAANLGPHGVAVAWARAEASVAFVRFSIAAYQEADDLLRRAADELAFAGGFAAGNAALPGAIAAAVANPAAGIAAWVSRRAVADTAEQTMYQQPWTQEIAARRAPGFVEGAVSSLLGGNPLLLAMLSGGHWPTSDLEGATEGLLAVAGPAGLLRDSGEFSVAARGTPTDVDLRGAGFVGELMHQQDRLSQGAAEVQVVRIQGFSGPAYVVQIPGTQEWNPRRGSNPVDTATNVHLIAGGRTAMADAVVAAMEAARIPRNAPVMLSGHSQGGMVAAALAADPQCRIRFKVAAVVTAGSPIGRVVIPDSVAVLSLEEKQDPVPRLDGAANPDRTNWVTVTRDLTDGDPTDADRGFEAAHSLRNYRQSGHYVDQSNDMALARWREAVAQFFGNGSAQRFRISLRESR